MEIFDENACAIDELTRENSKRSMENLNTNKPESKKWKWIEKMVCYLDWRSETHSNYIGYTVNLEK